MELVIFTDGGARGNPGPGAIGAVIYKVDKGEKKLQAELSEFLGYTTNNQAEYEAVIKALQWAKNNLQGEELKKIDFFLDSKLVVNQLKGIFKIKNPELGLKIRRIQELGAALKAEINYHYIPREKNKKADMLVNLALDNIKAAKV